MLASILSSSSFSTILHLGGKSSTQMGAFFYQMNANRLQTKTLFVQVSEREFLPPNCSKFAVECNWNTKISENVQIFWFFLAKRIGFFFEIVQ